MTNEQKKSIYRFVNPITKYYFIVASDSESGEQDEFISTAEDDYGDISSRHPEGSMWFEISEKMYREHNVEKTYQFLEEKFPNSFK